MFPYFSIEFIKIGAFTFYTWGFFVALSFLAGLVLAIGRSKKTGIAPKKTVILTIFIYVGAILGARLFFILQWPKEFLADPLAIFRIGNGGMMFLGGLLGGISGGWLYIKKWENRWLIINLLVPVVPLAMAVGRIGCFLSNDHQGALTNVPWAILWPDGIPRHPVALYLILFDLALAGFLWRLSKKEKWQSQILFVFLMMYSAGRFLLDFSRDAVADPHYFALAASQWLSLALLIFSGSILAIKLTKPTGIDINS